MFVQMQQNGEFQDEAAGMDIVKKLYEAEEAVAN